MLPPGNEKKGSVEVEIIFGIKYESALTSADTSENGRLVKWSKVSVSGF